MHSPPAAAALLPLSMRRAAALAAAVLLIGAAAWLTTLLVLRVALVTGSLLVAVLLAALLRPLDVRLRRCGIPAALTALLCALVLIALPLGVLLLLVLRASSQLDELGASLTLAVDRLRGRLVGAPLHLDDIQVDRVLDQVAAAVQGAVPSPVAGAGAALDLLAAALLVVVAVFFLLKDGTIMWSWLLDRLPSPHQSTAAQMGSSAWAALTGYVRGTLIVALVDAALIGIGLLVLGVPLWLSLMLLTFLAGFVPLLGAVAAGVVAVLVTLVTNGSGSALVVAALVVLVQQVEGSLLQPFVTGRAVRLHPLVILSAVTAGAVLGGALGALVAVPLVASGYHAVCAATRAPRSAAPADDAPRPRRTLPTRRRRATEARRTSGGRALARVSGLRPRG